MNTSQKGVGTLVKALFKCNHPLCIKISQWDNRTKKNKIIFLIFLHFLRLSFHTYISNMHFLILLLFFF